MKALLLAAGKGTRLWPLTEIRAKAAVPYRGEPLIRTLTRMLRASGITEYAVNLHHLPETVRGALEGFPVTYSYEPELLGTSGALHPLKRVLEGGWFWTINAKLCIDRLPPLSPQTRGEVITAVLAPAPAHAPYTRVDAAGDPLCVTGFRPAEAHDGTGWLFTGIQMVAPAIWEYLPALGFAHFTTDVYPRIWARDGRIGAYVMEDAWKEFSTLKRYLDYHIVAGANPAWWGSDARILPTAQVTESVLWDDVTVETGARVHQCVLADGVTVRAGRSIDRSVVVPLEKVARDPRGTVLDECLVVPIPP